MKLAHSHTRYLLGIAAAVFLLSLFFGHLIWASNGFYSGDTARGYLPQRVTLQKALSAGQLPWWDASLGLGYPLLAEGEVGGIYPLNWLLLAILPVDLSLNATLILHTAWCALGCYLWARSWGTGRLAALLGSCVFALGGFFAAHYPHLSITTVTSWMPWVLLCLRQLYATRSWRWATGLFACVALQFLAGHAQMSLLVMLAAGLYAIDLTLRRLRVSDDPQRARQRWVPVLMAAAAVGFGTAVALPQLVTGWELSQLSDRAGGLDVAYLTSFSFHPLMSVTYLVPWFRGNPWPLGSIEVMVYIGWLPLLLALWGVLRSRCSERWFLLVMALGGFVLSLGSYNPVYPLIACIPVLNLFRVPSRFIMWSSLGLAGLAVLGFEELLPRRTEMRCWGKLLTAILAAGILALWVVIATRPDVEALIELRWALPAGAALLALMLLAGSRQIERYGWAILAVGLVVVDLYGFQRVLNLTYSRSQPLEVIRTVPVLADWLSHNTTLYRLYTKEEILPIEFVQKESLYPNYAATYGLRSANLYIPLIPQRYQAYTNALDAAKLNQMNVKYYVIPQLLPVDAASELYDVHNPFANLPYNRTMEITPTAVLTLEVESYLSHSTRMESGELAANIYLRGANDELLTMPIRAGIESAEWAYERPDVVSSIRYPPAPIANTFVARSGLGPVEHAGHTYLATLPFTQPFTISSILIEPTIPEAFVRIEQIRLMTPSGERILLNHLIGQGDHRLIYRTEDAVVYQNHDAYPRAYLLTNDQAKVRDGELQFEALSGTPPEAEITHYKDQRVTIQTNTHEPGYLVLADLNYPGWEATIDGQPADIILAQGAFRALAIPAGSHQVEFRYNTDWFKTTGRLIRNAIAHLSR